MSEPPSQTNLLTESDVGQRLGVERLEVYLLAAAVHAGHYDPVTHLLVFTEAEAAALAGRLEQARREVQLAERVLEMRLPEPAGE